MSIINANQPITEDNKTMSQVMRTWHLAVSSQIPIIGTGSPEGVLEAPQYSIYLDDAGAAGSIQYRKMLPDIGGDKTQGWLLT